MNNSESSSTQCEVSASEYTCRLERRQRQLADIRLLHQRLWTYLIMVVLAVIVIVYATLSWHLISTLWILLPSAGVLSITQSLTKNARIHNRVQRIASFYELGVARLRHQWQGRGIDGDNFQPDNHPYASDLDVFGTGSLFELLCTARSGVGRATLARWLLHPAACGEVTERQAAVAELRDKLDLREDWASVGGDALDQVDLSAVRDWAEAPATSFPPYARAFGIVLPSFLIVLSMLARVGIFGKSWPWAIAVGIMLEVLFAAILLKKTRLIAANLVLPSFEMALLVPLLDRLETENLQCPWLKPCSRDLRLRGAAPRNKFVY